MSLDRRHSALASIANTEYALQCMSQMCETAPESDELSALHETVDGLLADMHRLQDEYVSRMASLFRRRSDTALAAIDTATNEMHIAMIDFQVNGYRDD
jgi:hypothetical protein